MSDERYQKEIAAFGAKLRELRLERKMTQLDFEMKVGMSRTEISKIERARKNIEFYTVVRIAEALGVELHALFEPVKKKDAERNANETQSKSRFPLE